jgi:hypothetical protein
LVALQRPPFGTRCPYGGAVHIIKGERLFGASTLSGACVLCVLVRRLIG